MPCLVPEAVDIVTPDAEAALPDAGWGSAAAYAPFRGLLGLVSIRFIR
jgi:hypothetical protein